MASLGFWLDPLIRATLILNCRETATCLRSFHVYNKPVGSTRMNTPGQVHGSSFGLT